MSKNSNVGRNENLDKMLPIKRLTLKKQKRVSQLEFKLDKILSEIIKNSDKISLNEEIEYLYEQNERLNQKLDKIIELKSSIDIKILELTTTIRNIMYKEDKNPYIYIKKLKPDFLEEYIFLAIIMQPDLKAQEIFSKESLNILKTLIKKKYGNTKANLIWKCIEKSPNLNIFIKCII